MFDELADPHPPEPDAGARALVGRRAQQLHHRAVAMRSALGVLVLLLFVGGVVAAGRRGDDSKLNIAAVPSCCGSVAGTVRSVDAPQYVASATVQLMLAVDPASTTRGSAVNPWRVVKTTRTDAYGHYEIHDLEAGQYLLRVEERGGLAKHQPVFYAGADVASEATPITVTPNEMVTVDPEMAVQTNTDLRGVVRANKEGGFPIRNITVRLFADGELVRETVTGGVGGSYEFKGIEPGTYTMAFVDRADDRTADPYPTMWFGGDATPVPFTVPPEGLLNANMVLR